MTTTEIELHKARVMVEYGYRILADPGVFIASERDARSITERRPETTLVTRTVVVGEWEPAE